MINKATMGQANMLAQPLKGKPRNPNGLINPLVKPAINLGVIKDSGAPVNFLPNQMQNINNMFGSQVPNTFEKALPTDIIDQTQLPNDLMY